jgi:hypothetical protein
MSGRHTPGPLRHDADRVERDPKIREGDLGRFGGTFNHVHRLPSGRKPDGANFERVRSARQSIQPKCAIGIRRGFDPGASQHRSVHRVTSRERTKTLRLGHAAS